MKLNKWLSALICALLTFSIDILLIPQFMGGTPDLLWMSAMILFPLAAAWLFYDKLSRPAAGLLFAGMGIQYLLLIVMAEPVSQSFGVSVTRVLGWFEYIGAVFPWPLAVALAQFLMILIIRKVRTEVPHE